MYTVFEKNIFILNRIILHFVKQEILTLPL